MCLLLLGLQQQFVNFLNSSCKVCKLREGGVLGEETQL